MSELLGLPGLDGGRLRQASVLIAGAGNIGSPLAILLARADVRLLRLVDRDVVEEKNLANQDFRPGDVGKPKAAALAERLREQVPGVVVEAYYADLEAMPLGVFAVDLVLGALDSRRARQALVSEIAWPQGTPVVDGGVGEGLLGRVQVFVSGADHACLECGWGNEDYRKASAEYPCIPGEGASGPATLAPAFAGSVVAGLMAAEAVRILAGDAGESREIAFDLFHRRFLPSRLRRAARCRFDHVIVGERLHLTGDVNSATVGDMLRLIEGRFGQRLVHLEHRYWPFVQEGFRAERFATPDRLRPLSDKPLAALGLVRGDWIRVRSADENAYLVLGTGACDSAACGLAGSGQRQPAKPQAAKVPVTEENANGSR
jgi:molybdopterin/thiamine biosynthesis adenylyltransferase